MSDLIPEIIENNIIEGEVDGDSTLDISAVPEIIIDGEVETSPEIDVEMEAHNLTIIAEIIGSGPRGPIPKHVWISSHEIMFENPDGTWGEVQDLNTGIGGTIDYEELMNKPKIEDFELVGDISLDDIGVTTISINEISNIL